LSNSDPAADPSRLSVALVEVAPGREADFRALAAAFASVVTRKHYGRADAIQDEVEPLRYYAVRHWTDARAAQRCHADPEVQAIMARLYQFARVTHIINGARRSDPVSRAAVDRRARGEADRRAGFDRRLVSGAGPTGSERRSGTDRRMASRRAGDQGGLELVPAARAARERASAAFSNFKVGAALETASGLVVTGCNVENATYGLTICAERVAMFKALSEGHRAFTRIAIVADTEEPTPPCGACRQILWEFGGDLEIQLANLEQIKGTFRLGDLLPLPFDRRLL
jgi:cytidine deaminase